MTQLQQMRKVASSITETMTPFLDRFGPTESQSQAPFEEESSAHTPIRK
jgi:hypothetical protein